MKKGFKVYLGADHAGFKLKEKIKGYLDSKKIEYEDLTPVFVEGDDYPDVAVKVGEKVAKDKEARGILVCGSGSGMTIMANKVKGIRAVDANDPITAKLSREDNDSNVLSLGAWLLRHSANEIVRKWLATEFSNLERHKRRLDKIERYEREW